VSFAEKAIKRLQERDAQRAAIAIPPSGANAQLPPAGAQLPAVGPHHTWMAVLLIVMVGEITEWVPGISGLPLAKVAFLFAAIYTARVRHQLLPVRVTSLRIARPALAFLALSILSVFFSIYKSNTLVSSEGSVIQIVTFVMLVKITQTMRDVERMLLALVGSAVSLTLGVLVNYSGGRAHINDSFDPNDIAYVLDTLLPIVVAYGVAHSKRRKWLAYGLAMSMIAAILLTGSRGGVIGLGVVALGLFAFPLSFSKTGELRGFAPGGLIVKLACLALLGGAVWGSLPADVQERYATLVDLRSDYNADPNLKASRTVIWRVDLELALRRPIGYGLGAAGAAYGHNGGDYHTSHNSLVQALVELGVPGLVLFISTYFLSWRELGKVARRGLQRSVDHEIATAALYARALRLALLGNIVAGFFLSEAYSSCLWMIVAICAAFVRVATTSFPATGTPTGLETPMPAGAAA
jgi:O-antigen ligase